MYPKRAFAVGAVFLALTVAVAGCGEDERPTGTSSLTVELTNLVGAAGSQTRADLSQDAGDYFSQTPTWEFLTTEATSSPYSVTDTVAQLPEGDFLLSITAGSDEDSQGASVKGQGCEMTLTLGQGEDVTITIDGLNEFADQGGYGECAATIVRE